MSGPDFPLFPRYSREKSKVRTHELAAAVLGLVFSSTTARAQAAPPPVDVKIYVTRGKMLPRCEDLAARAIASQIYANIGVRTAWIDGQPMSANTVAGMAVIHVRFAPELMQKISSEALAYCSPFAENAKTITIFYERIRIVAGRFPVVRERILGHVLAHEIGHILEGTDRHSREGVMKAHWDWQDCFAMNKHPLEFTSTDIHLIRRGLESLKAHARYPAGGTSSP
jgi:hypothetical protein